MKKLFVSLLAIASVVAANAQATDFVLDENYDMAVAALASENDDPTAVSYFTWVYQDDPQALNVNFPNAGYVDYLGLEEVRIRNIEGTVVGTGKVSRVAEAKNHFTCVFDQELAPGDYYIGARENVFRCYASAEDKENGVYTPDTYFPITFTVPEKEAAYKVSFDLDPANGSTISKWQDWTITFTNATSAEWNLNNKVVDVTRNGKKITTAEIEKVNDTSYKFTNFEGEITDGDYTITLPVGAFTAFKDENNANTKEIVWTVTKTGGTTSINAINASENNAVMFDMTGRRVNSANGIVIINGMKAIIK